MAEFGTRLVVPIDLKKKPWEQKHVLHNRWHPDIPPVEDVKTGEVFRVEMMDFSGGRITRNYSAIDIKHADQSIDFLRATDKKYWKDNKDFMKYEIYKKHQLIKRIDKDIRHT